MKTNNYQCVNCQIHFDIEENYMIHYKSEHHRYNIKRKLIGLPPLTFEEYHLQFEQEKTSKHSVDQDFYCQICSKKFVNSGTYKQHISSKKHKINRAQLKAPEKYTMSKSSSSSDFQVIGAEKVEVCLFCQHQGTVQHMKKQHNFPPFQSQCMNYNGLVLHLKQKIQQFQCVYCHLKFTSEEGVRQHMSDVGHTKLDIENFDEYEKFYLWKIQQTSSESEQQLVQEQLTSAEKQSQHSMYEQLNHPTLHELEQKRQQRIQYTTTGAIINGKQVGYRYLKKYYKQYLNRQIINPRQKYQPAIQSQKSQWTLAMKVPDRPPKITMNVNFR